MHRPRATPYQARLLAGLIVVVAILLSAAPFASAHAELIESSPAADSTVGGEFHQIAMQFTGLDVLAPQQFELLDPTGTAIGSPIAREGQRVVIPIEPLEVPGTYTVRFTLNGADGDVSTGGFQFRFDPAAPEPAGLTFPQSGDDGFDLVGFGLLLAAAAIAAFLVHRILQAWREHRAAQAVRS